MNNKEYALEVRKRITIVRKLERECISTAKGIIGATLFKEDFFFFASADRSINLIEGMIDLLKKRNLTCVGPLLRIQMDNCMRTYAAFIADNKDRVVECIISGNQINKEKDINGNRLNDGYLKKELSKIDPLFEEVYNQASGFIHLSSKAFYQTVISCEDSKIEFRIGGDLPEKRNANLLEAADAFIHFTQLHIQMLKVVADSKKRYDSLVEEL